MTGENGHQNVAFEEENQTDIALGPITAFSTNVNMTDFDEDSNTETFFDKYSAHIRIARICLINFLVGAYFTWATYYYIENTDKSQCKSVWCDGYGMLLLLMIFTYTGLFYFNVIKRFFGRSIATNVRPIKRQFVHKFNSIRFMKLIIVLSILFGFAIYIGIDAYDSPERFRSILGLVTLLGIGYCFSKHRSEINWRPVVCGIILQFLFAMFCIRMEIGRSIFKCVGDKVATFFNFAKQGASFVYGNELVNMFNVFAFAVLPVIFFFSFIVSLLYYYGTMQWTIQKLGWILQSMVGTTLCESVTVAANIFLGMTESPLVIKPYIKYLTASEIHVIMTSGFATVSGTVLAAYISFGADPAHLITASVMAAPATLAFSKLIYPETEISLTTSKSVSMEKSSDSSALDAASNGAMAALPLIAGITANLVAFVSFVAFANSVVNWFGMLVGYDFITMEWFVGKLFIPLAYVIGIPWEDCEKVGGVIATKNIINDFVAYQRLGVLREQNAISPRSAAIATFAICGFANLSSLGIMIGNLGSMCPEKRNVITSVAVRALISGSIISLINASIAGLLMTDELFMSISYDNLTFLENGHLH